MPSIEITSQLAEHVDCPSTQTIDASTLEEALENLFTQYPQLRAQVLDDNGSIHQHLALFVDGEMLQQRDQLQVPVSDGTEIFVMQAISGG